MTGPPQESAWGSALLGWQDRPSERALQRVADLHEALADRTRLGILSALVGGERCVGDLASLSGLSASSASHQLRRLRDMGIVAFHRRGRLALYRLVDPYVERLVTDGMAWAERDVLPSAA